MERPGQGQRVLNSLPDGGRMKEGPTSSAPLSGRNVTEVGHAFIRRLPESSRREHRRIRRRQGKDAQGSGSRFGLLQEQRRIPNAFGDLPVERLPGIEVLLVELLVRLKRQAGAFRELKEARVQVVAVRMQ